MKLQNVIYASMFLMSVNFITLFGCERHKRKDLSQTKCVPGRRFFARLDRIPMFHGLFSKKELTQPYFYPWIAMLSSFYAGKTITCTGTLINDRYIVTVQHCVLPPIKPQHLTVYLGSQRLPSGYQNLYASAPIFMQHQVTGIILHPNYDYHNIQTSSNDLALVRIVPVVYSKTIYPIQLPSYAEMYYDFSNTMAENVGWQTQRKTVFDRTQAVIISNTNCSNHDVYYKRNINRNLLCSVSTEEDYRNSCSMPGSPLMVEDHKRVYNITILLGIASWSFSKGNSCFRNKSPTVYVRIDKKLDWIHDNTRDALYCRY